MMGGVLCQRKIAYWLNCQFSIASQFNDLSGHNRAFTMPLAAVNVGATYNAEGALLCDGSNFLKTQDQLPLSLAPFEISLDAYVVSSSNPYSALIAQRTNSVFEDVILYALDTEILQLVIRFTDSDLIVLTAPYNRNEWFNVKFKRDVNNLFSLSVNGNVIDSVTSVKAVNNSSGGFFNIANANSAISSGTPTGAIRNLKIIAL